MINAHSFSFTKLDGTELPLAQFKGKLILIVNTASMCTFTEQYQGLNNLASKYPELVIIATPCNDFGNQEPDSEDKIKDFCETNYKINFILTKKIQIKDNPHPFYAWAKQELGFLAAPKWNFHKYLVDKQGNLAEWFSSITEPDEYKVFKVIEELKNK